MGFTTGFLGGLTLTYSIIYFTVYVHRSNRTYQSLLLRQQANLLNSKVDPPEPEYDLPAYRVEKAGLEEQLKDRWNSEVESLVQKVQNTDWEATRIRWENRIGNVWGKVRSSETGKEIEQKIGEVKDGVKSIGTTDVKQLKQTAQQAVQGKRLLDES